MASAYDSIPTSLRAISPAMTPPPGVQPNFVDPPDTGSSYVAAASVFVAVGFVFYASRVYATAFIMRKVSWDDLTCALGFAFATISAAALIWGTSAGPFGRHPWDVSVAQIMAHDFTVSVWMDYVFVTPALGFIKLSIFLLYYNTFWPMKWVRIAVYVGAGFTVVFYVAMTIATLAISIPRPGEGWFNDIFGTGGNQVRQLLLPLGVVGLVIDIALLLLPIRAVWKLNLRLESKIGVTVVFMAGFFACICSFIGLVYRILYQASAKDDLTTGAPLNIILWAVIETQVGLVVACMPLFAKMLSHHLPRNNALRARIRSNIRSLLPAERRSKWREFDTERSYPPVSDRSGSEQRHELGRMKGKTVGPDLGG